MSAVRIGAHRVALPNQDKVLFPDAGLTKGDLIRYYRRVAAHMLPYLQGRPLTLQRFPGGIDKEGFIQRPCAPSPAPSPRCWSAGIRTR